MFFAFTHAYFKKAAVLRFKLKVLFLCRSAFTESFILDSLHLYISHQDVTRCILKFNCENLTAKKTLTLKNILFKIIRRLKKIN